MYPTRARSRCRLNVGPQVLTAFELHISAEWFGRGVIGSCHSGRNPKRGWIEYIKRSTREAEEQMKKANIPCWIEARRRMKWIMAMRIASLPEEKWSRKTAEWNPGLDNCIKTKDRLADREKDGKINSMSS